MGTNATDSTDNTEDVKDKGNENPAGTDLNENPADPEVNEDPDGVEDNEDGSEDPDLSAEDALKALKKVRKEAANYRTRLRQTEDKFKDAKTADEVQAAIDELSTQNQKDNLDLIRENVQLRFNLPDDLAATLQGNTREELEKQAEVLSKYVVPKETEDPELGGGLDPTTSSDGNEDIAAMVKRNRTSRY